MGKRYTTIISIGRLSSHRVFTSAFLISLLLLAAAAPAQITFKNITTQAGINILPVPVDEMGGGMVVIDYDKDGWEDLYCAGGEANDALYHNNHDGTFTDVSAQAGIQSHGLHFTHGGAALDFDQDGWPDLYVSCVAGDILYRNNHDGTFTDVSTKSGILPPTGENNNATVTFGDFNGDGLNDIYVARYIDSEEAAITDTITGLPDYTHRGLHNYLYLNNGNGTFTECAEQYGIDKGPNPGCSLIALFFDYDRDGDLDLIIGNDFGYYLQPNLVFKNLLTETGKAQFVNVSDSSGLGVQLFCMGIAPNDFNRDGNFDFFEANIGPEALLQGDGTHFYDVATETGAMMGIPFWDTKLSATSWSPVCVDLDNDGWEDIFEPHGKIPVYAPRYTYELDSTRVMRNVNGKFTDVTLTSGILTHERGRSGMTFDFNQDGKMDVGFAAIEYYPGNPSKGVSLYQNTTQNAGHWLEITLHGKTCGAEAIGTCIEVWEHGNRHLRQVSTGGTLCSQSSLIQHVGLGSSEIADSILIFWPRKPIERYYNVKADQRIEYTEGAQYSVSKVVQHHAVTLYPTVAQNIIHLDNLKPSDQVEVEDILGRTVYQSHAFSTVLHIALERFAQGSYIVKISGGSSTQLLRFVKE
jgi:hypothetical protein